MEILALPPIDQKKFGAQVASTVIECMRAHQ